MLRDINLKKVELAGNLACLLLEDGKLFITHNSKDPELLMGQCKKTINEKDWLEFPELVSEIAIGTNNNGCDFCVIPQSGEATIFHCRLQAIEQEYVSPTADFKDIVELQIND